jgi:hypothetical protein
VIAVLVVITAVVAAVITIRMRRAHVARDAAARRLVQSELWRKELGNRAIDHALFTRRTIDEAIDEIKRVAHQQRGER